jgi:hypothetical protein
MKSLLVGHRGEALAIELERLEQLCRTSPEWHGDLDPAEEAALRSQFSKGDN